MGKALNYMTSILEKNNLVLGVQEKQTLLSLYTQLSL